MTGAAEGRRVLVTGGASGIGLAMAGAFAAEGARVFVADAAAERVAGLAHSHPGLVARSLDVTEPAAVDRLVDEAIDPAGGLDALCANAGTAGPTGDVEALDLEAWRACLSVNLDGAFLVVRRAVPAMKRRRRGVIRLTSSAPSWCGPAARHRAAGPAQPLLSAARGAR